VADTILDTSICIDLLRGRREAREHASARRPVGRLLLHTAVLAELYQGARGRAEFRAIDALVVSTDPAAPSAHDLATSLKLLRRHGPSAGVEWHDCLIAATALRLGAVVATLNDKHFRAFRALKVIRPY
jgi:hypothetical protein